MQKSETIGELAKALAVAQGEIQNAKKDSENPFFKSKYADLAAVREAYQGPLSKNGLALIQTPRTSITEESTIVFVETLLCHSSGEWISEELSAIPVKTDPQGIGSCITYLRRYGAGAITGVAADDDDGNAASRPFDGQSAQKPVQPKLSQKSAEITQLKKAAVDACQMLNKAGDEIKWGAKKLDEFAVTNYGAKADDLELEPMRELVKKLSVRLDDLKKGKNQRPRVSVEDERYRLISEIKVNAVNDKTIEQAMVELKIEPKPLGDLSLDALIQLNEHVSIPF